MSVGVKVVVGVNVGVKVAVGVIVCVGVPTDVGGGVPIGEGVGVAVGDAVGRSARPVGVAVGVGWEEAGLGQKRRRAPRAKTRMWDASSQERALSNTLNGCLSTTILNYMTLHSRVWIMGSLSR